MCEKQDNSSQTSPRQQWSLLRVILSFGLQPRKMSTRVGHIPLWKAFWVGVGSVIAGGLVLLVLSLIHYWIDTDNGVLEQFSWYSTLSDSQKQNYPQLKETDLLTQARAFRLYCYFSCGLLLMLVPISAELTRHHIRRVNKKRRGSHCARLIFLQLILWPVLMMTCCAVVGWDTLFVNRGYSGWSNLILQPPDMPDIPASNRSQSPEWSQYLQNRENYLRQKDCYSALSTTRGAYRKNEQESSFLLSAMIAMLVIWLLVLGRAFIINKHPEKIQLNREGHPICLNCEYDLHRQPVKSKCPECGKPVSESISHYYMFKNDQGVYAASNPSLKQAKSEPE